MKTVLHLLSLLLMSPAATVLAGDDLTTTVGPARYLAAQGYFPTDRVSQKTYEGGHMAYTNEAALEAFTSDVRAFVTPRP